MNDSFEDQLRALRPGKLPAVLAGKLSTPPAARRNTILGVLFATSAAACIAFVLLREAAPGFVPAKPPSMAGRSFSRVTEAHPLSVITDESNRTWRMMEVNWVDESTMVATGRPVAVRLEDNYRTVVPVAVQFD